MSEGDIELDMDEVLTEKPTLYDINQSFNVIQTDNYAGLVGEEEARMVLFTNFILGEKPCILKGSRASGKSNTIRVVTKYAKSPVDISSSSEKAYQRNRSLNDHSHFIIPEINKVNEQVVEMLKDFGEGESHKYTFTNEYKEVETITIDPKAFITSIADENRNVGTLGEELLSRVTVVRTDSSVKQNIDVIEEKLKRAANPFQKQDIGKEKISKYVAYVQNLPSISEFKFLYPAGEDMRTAIPPLFTDSRRDVGKYLANTYGITLFHYRDRMEVDFNDNRYLIVTPVDMWYNHVIYQNILLESSLKCGKMEQKILETLKDKGSEYAESEFGDKVSGMKVSDIHTELLKASYTPTIDSVRKMCDGLMEVGYVTRNEEVRPYKYEINPELNREYDVSVNWKKIVDACAKNMKENFPDLAEDYISKYCQKESLEVVHPFTGETINILDGHEKSKETLDLDEDPTSLEDLKKEQEALKKSIMQSKESDDEEEEVSDEEIVLDDNGDAGEVDEQDNLQDRLLELLADEPLQVHEITESLGAKSVEVERLLNYLTRISEVIEVEAGKYKRL